MSGVTNSIDINELALNLQEKFSISSNVLDFVNDVPAYEYPEDDLPMPANSVADAIDYAYTVAVPGLEDIALGFQDNVPQIPDGCSLSHCSFGGDSPGVDFPVIKTIGRLNSYNILAEIFKCYEYPMSYLEFWFLDIVEECLMYAQDCPALNQDNFCLVITFLVNFLRDVRLQQLDLCGMLTHFRLKIECYIKRHLIKNYEVIFEGENEFEAPTSSPDEDENKSSEVEIAVTDIASDDNKSQSEESTNGAEDNMSIDVTTYDSNELFFILEYIYKAFGNSFIYKTLQIAMLDPPVYVEQDLPYRMEFPKYYLPQYLENPTPPYVKQKAAKGDKKGKKAKKKDTKPKKEKGKSRDKSTQSSPEREQEQTDDELERLWQEAEQRRRQELKKYILPLKMSVGPEYYQELFKPPPKPEKREKKGKAKEKGGKPKQK